MFIFTFYISYTCVECGKDVMSYFASSSSSIIVTHQDKDKVNNKLKNTI